VEVNFYQTNIIKMVTRLENNFEYIVYIREKMKENLPEWKENSNAYEGQPNSNFFITFQKNEYRVSFTKDRGCLEVSIYYNDELVRFRFADNPYNFILKYIPEQDPNWQTSLCTELIDYYIDYLVIFQNNRNIK
jgi:hypothetical protein